MADTLVLPWDNGSGKMTERFIMLYSHFRLILTALVFAGVSAISRAEDNTVTVYGDGASVNLGTDLTIGNSGTNNFLIITNGSKLRNVMGVLGNEATADFNSVLVSGVGSIWSNIPNSVSTSNFFLLGATGSFNQVVITNGGRLISGINDASLNIIGRDPSSSGNFVTVTGTNSAWVMRGQLRLGSGPSNQLHILNGALVSTTGITLLGDDTVGSPAIPGANRLIVAGTNSLLTAGNSVGHELWLGRLSGNNQLIVTNAGRINSFSVLVAHIGNHAGTNLALVTGVGSQWNVNGNFTVQRRANEIRIEDGGLLTVNSNVLVGASSDRNDNRITVAGGTFVVTNAGGTASVNFMRGTNLLSSGTMTTDRLTMTNGANSIFVFNGGTLNTKNTSISNAAAFLVGDGSSVATLHTHGGSHSFFHGLRVTNNATLKGTGTITANTTVHGTLAPGSSPGLLQVVGSLTLASNAVFEAELNGTAPGTLYDQVDVLGTVDISGSILSLTVGFEPSTGTVFTIIANDDVDPVVGTFLGLTENSFIDASSGGNDAYFRISYIGGTGNDVILTATIPEPSVVSLLALAVCALFSRTRSRG
jgi:T5SS/PEP-CTERM-associated repeat protein